jgi:hypothetical protein
MTTDITLTPAPAADEDERLFCFRHPERETWIRCGRCDKPICVKCGLMGPVGMRCKDCGRLRNDPLTSFSPTQLALGLGAAIGAGTIGGLIGLQLGILAIFIGPFAGGLIGETVLRVTGYKRGPVMQSIVIGGILAGAVLAALIEYQMMTSMLGANELYPFVTFLASSGAWLLIWVGATLAGAWTRIR